MTRRVLTCRGRRSRQLNAEEDVCARGLASSERGVQVAQWLSTLQYNSFRLFRRRWLLLRRAHNHVHLAVVESNVPQLYSEAFVELQCLQQRHAVHGEGLAVQLVSQHRVEAVADLGEHNGRGYSALQGGGQAEMASTT